MSNHIFQVKMINIYKTITVHYGVLLWILQPEVCGKVTPISNKVIITYKHLIMKWPLKNFLPFTTSLGHILSNGAKTFVSFMYICIINTILYCIWQSEQTNHLKIFSILFGDLGIALSYTQAHWLLESDSLTC